MAAATYHVYFDLSRNGGFTDANEDVTGYVKAIAIKRGCAAAYDTLARDTTMDITLDNSDGRFSPDGDNALAGFRPGMLVKVTMTYNSVTETLAIGRVEPDGIEVEPGVKAGREARVRTYGLLKVLQERADVVLPLLTDQRTDQVINELVTRGRVYPFVMVGARVGVPGYMEVGRVRVAGAATDYLDMDTGNNTIAYVGDKWGAQTSLYGMLRDLAAAERGLIYETRDGKLAFRSRHFFIADVGTALDGTIDGSLMVTGKKQDYRFGKNLLNDASVTAYPRKVATARTVVARTPAGYIIVPGGSVTWTLDYTTSGGNIIGANSVLCEATTDYALAVWDSVNQQVVAGSPSVSVSVNAGANKVELTFTSTDSSLNALLQAGSTESGYITVRGYAITTFDPLTMQATDDTSVAENFRHAARLDLKLLTDTNVAYSTALYEVVTRRDARGEFAAVTISANKNATAMAYARDLTIGDRIAVQEGQTGIDAEYFIVGEEHRVLSAYEHYVTYTLRPVQTMFGVVGATGWMEVGRVKVSY